VAYVFYTRHNRNVEGKIRVLSLTRWKKHFNLFVCLFVRSLVSHRFVCIGFHYNISLDFNEEIWKHRRLKGKSDLRHEIALAKQII
jgi:hypothetical protein